MLTPPRRLGDAMLTAFGVVVLVGAYVAVTDKPSPPQSELVATAIATQTPAATPTQAGIQTPDSSAPTPMPAAAPILVAGPDLDRIAADLGTALHREVIPLVSTGQQVVVPSALAAVTSLPGSIVLQVTAGSKTTARTRTAIRAVRQRFPGVPVFVVGPFSAGDPQSAAAAKAAATGEKATFLDPVAAQWRTDAGSSVLSPQDQRVVVAILAARLKA